MKRLLAFVALCLPIYILAQGFGSFTHDQPYFAKDTGGSVSNYFYIRYNVSELGYPDGTVVSNMPDTGTLHYNALAIQNMGTTAPYYTNNVGEINNQGYLFFNGVSNYLQTNFTATFQQPLHVLMVAKLPYQTVFAGKVFFDSGTNGGGYGFYTAEGKTLLSAGAWCSSTNWVTNWTMLEFCFDGPNSFVRTNGKVMQTGNTGTNSLAGLTLGAERTGLQAADMKMAYAAFYTNVLSDAVAGTETTNLAATYGITMYPRDVLNSWNPTLNNTNLLIHYDLSMLRMNTGQSLTNWFDNGPKGYHLLASNYAGSGINPVATSFYNRRNGRFYTETDATAQSNYFATNFVINFPQPTTIWAVMIDNGHVGGLSNMKFDDGGDNLVYQGLYSDVGPSTRFNAGSILNLSSGITGNYKILEVYINGASSYVKANNTSLASGNAGANGRKGLTIGAPRTQNMQFSSVGVHFFAVYTNTLTATESSNVLFYLRDRFPRPE